MAEGFDGGKLGGGVREKLWVGHVGLDVGNTPNLVVGTKIIEMFLTILEVKFLHKNN